ncbi:MAG: T9SS type A sorting domain-containing protein, partial [Saprospiraceae bacterium]|nr:T9SS type A sorting domain-containing protein [Saprospiraceae bacterium]
FPNPTDANATMNFTLAESMFLNVDVINTLGQRVQRVSAQQFAAGQHTIELNTSELPNGLYYINVSSADKQLTYKVAVSR